MRTLVARMKKNAEKIVRHLKELLHAIPNIPRDISEFGLAVAVMRYRRAIGIVTVKKYIEFMSSCFGDILKPVTDKYKNSMPVTKLEKKIDFGNRIPVWVCWFQGKEKMPPICKACVNSIRKSLPLETEFVFLTYENYISYLDIPEEIIEKHTAGIINASNYSDIVRYGLLATYGGIWLDAAIYISPNTIKDALEHEYLTPRFYREGHKLEDASRGRWIGGSWFSKQENLLFQYVYDALIFFWRKYNRALEYLACDYIIWNAYTNISYIKEILDEVPINNEKIRLLNENLEKPYDKILFESIIKETGVHLIDRHKKYLEKTETGDCTIYGYLLNLEDKNRG